MPPFSRTRPTPLMQPVDIDRTNIPDTSELPGIVARVLKDAYYAPPGKGVPSMTLPNGEKIYVDPADFAGIGSIGSRAIARRMAKPPLRYATKHFTKRQVRKLESKIAEDAAAAATKFEEHAAYRRRRGDAPFDSSAPTARRASNILEKDLHAELISEATERLKQHARRKLPPNPKLVEVLLKRGQKQQLRDLLSNYLRD